MYSANYYKYKYRKTPKWKLERKKKEWRGVTEAEGSMPAGDVKEVDTAMEEVNASIERDTAMSEWYPMDSPRDTAGELLRKPN